MTVQLKGIDVSSHQGDIDWKKVKASGVEFAIIRLGYGEDVESQDDRYFFQNVKGCEENSIPWGAYLYSYAMDLKLAADEADHALRMLNGLKPTYPIYIDMEDTDGYKRKRGGISEQMATDICVIFCEKLEKAGYCSGVYANKDWLINRLDSDKLSRFTIWLAQWSSVPTYDGEFQIWQYTSDGSVDGISGCADMNLCYVNFPAAIKTVSTKC